MRVENRAKNKMRTFRNALAFDFSDRVARALDVPPRAIML
jgi:hypothetical protein